MDIKTKNAASYFHAAPYNYNCAQAILKAYQGDTGLADAYIENARAWGGGRAEGGTCGALHAANDIATRMGKSVLTEKFRAKVGHVCCHEIKQNGKVPCQECVRIADELLSEL